MDALHGRWLNGWGKAWRQLQKNGESWRQHPTKQQLYGHLLPITKTIKVRQTRHAGHCRRSGDELISDVFLWTTSHGRAKAGRPARTYLQQLGEDTGCSPEDQPEAMNNREERRDRERERESQGCPCWWHDKMMMINCFSAGLCYQSVKCLW